MSNIYDIFNERKSSVSMISEGFDYDYFDRDSIEDFDSIEEGIEVLTNLQKEMQNTNIRLCAESLVSDLLLEESMYEDFNEDNITEMIEESLKEKASNVGNKIQELWGKVKAWFAGLFNSITNHFKNGETLLKKYPDLKDRLKSSTSKVKAYKMVAASGAIKNCSTLSNKLSFYEVYETKDFKSSVFSKLGVQDKKELKTTVMKFFVMGKLEKEELVISSLNPAIVINYAVSKKDIIDGLKDQQKNLDDDFKNALNASKKNKSDAEDKEAKKYINDVMSVLNFIFNVKSDIIKVEIAMVKKLSNMCLSICRHVCGGASSSASNEEPEPANKGEYIPTKQDRAANSVAKNKAAKESFDYLMSSLDEEVTFDDDLDF
jgi:hypothetical protein